MYANAIKTIENLDGLQQLESLWLNENLITKIEVRLSFILFFLKLYIDLFLKFKGLSGAKNLRELNLASNQIRFKGQSNPKNTELKVLNLADNKISSFQVKNDRYHIE
mgnify:CR=1 FL=1